MEIWVKIKQKGEKFHRIWVKTVLGNKMLLLSKERKFTKQEVRIMNDQEARWDDFIGHMMADRDVMNLDK